MIKPVTVSDAAQKFDISKVTAEEGWHFQGNTCVQQHSSCVLVTSGERNYDSFLAPKLVQLHQRLRVSVEENLLPFSLGCCT